VCVSGLDFQPNGQWKRLDRKALQLYQPAPKHVLLNRGVMQAYAVMDGGGIKGAALAGCLQAAEKFGIEFIGFGAHPLEALSRC